MFFLSVMQWLGLLIMAVGVWAWTEKDTFNNLTRLTNVALDPAFILILVGEYASSFSRSILYQASKFELDRTAKH